MQNEVLEIAKKRMRRKVGSGSNTSFWIDCWVEEDCCSEIVKAEKLKKMANERAVKSRSY